jgi:hypothetical protein
VPSQCCVQPASDSRLILTSPAKLETGSDGVDAEFVGIPAMGK